MVDPCDLGEVVRRRTILLHILSPGVAESLRRAGRAFAVAARCANHLDGAVVGRSAVWEIGLKRAGEHLLEANDEDAVCGAVGDELAREVDAGAAAGAVIVDIVDWDLGHACGVLINILLD